MHRLYLALCILALIFSSWQMAHAKEGMWTPQQLPDLARDMKRLGLKLKAKDVSDLTGFPMGAVISLGGCTASFVSKTGLVVTNHHCARGSVQFNSNAQRNYLKDGFLAASYTDELPAAPGSRAFVTVALKDVTEDILRAVPPAAQGRARYQAIDDARKALIAECERDPGHRCQVATFYGGASYRLIKRLEIKDLRLVYAPADAIGRYGGDEDNWLWPRHTGDFAFYRAYVSPQGKPAAMAAENVPYVPKHVLKVSARGVRDGDFAMVAGYPGRTQRYRRPAEVAHAFTWEYPRWIDLADSRIETIKEAAPEGSDARVKYENLLAGLNNYTKNRKGQIKGARRAKLVERRDAQNAVLMAWIAEDDTRAGFSQSIDRLDALIEDSNAQYEIDFLSGYVLRAQLLSAARTLYRLAKEREKPDTQRARGYQDRDLPFIKQRLEALDRRYDADVDQALWTLVIEKYLAQPKDFHVAEIDAALGLSGPMKASALQPHLAKYYAGSALGDLTQRLAWLDKKPEDFEASDDAFIQLAVALFDYDKKNEDDAKERAGKIQAVRPDYMRAIIAWKQSQNAAVYPDANSTLRVTYGTVMGGAPQDGLIYEPFTRLEGIAAKHTGDAPFNAPPRQLQLIAAKDYGRYALKQISSVPVNFLTDLDSTGGNSGSPTLDKRGNLVGLLFDGTIESVNSDWDFDPQTTRSIHVDTRYMLWVMEKVDGAQRLVNEMDIVR
ncbi:MAG: S46 family peptidase [Pseudomonadota bacterium]